MIDIAVNLNSFYTLYIGLRFRSEIFAFRFFALPSIFLLL